MTENKKTIEAYNRISKDYAVKNAKNDVVHLQRELFYALVRNGIVYDFGCGCGRDVYAFSQYGLEVTGFDASESLLSIARENYPEQRFNALDMLSDSWDIPDKADGIWACASLLHFSEIEFQSVFNRLVELLKDKGILYFSVKTKDTISSETIDGRFFHYHTKHWLDEHLSSYPFLELVHYEENTNQDDRFASYFLRYKVPEVT